ncbi:MAG TPA: aminotransferase class I/II-fold pyridoxal phosphate-dependent enzyme [Chitinophagaceae bacterium]|nr:aminotransferase class I/II-fold pyridoxal phosphate-dependent enzyme [Chitinophagaceae bacterium]
MFSLDDSPGRKCKLEGKEFLFFSGYAYLGMNHVKEFSVLVKEGIDKYGILFPSSRISNTRLNLFEKLEQSLSELTGMEDTVSFSSGYLAGKTISDILSSHKNILVAPGTHPAIDIKTDNPISSTNFNEWKNEVPYFINDSGGNEFVIISDSVDVLKAQVHHFSFVKNIDPSKKITFLIDDSHGIGILGKNGEGIISQLPQKENVEYIICYSLSKAFNIEGGAISCSKKWSEKIRQHHNYTGSTPINPSLIHAFLKSKELYAVQRKKLVKNINYLRKHLPASIIKHDFDLPVFVCSNEDAEEFFYQNKIIISSFGYPDPTSQKINRVVINALHTKKDIQRLISVL